MRHNTKKILISMICILVTNISLAQVTTPLSLGEGSGVRLLSRHVLAVPQSASGSKYLVSWRMLDSDDDYTTFDVIKNGTVIASNINNSTNWLDTNGSKTAKYQVVTKKRGEVVSTT